MSYLCGVEMNIREMKRRAIVSAIKEAIHRLPMNLEARLYGSEARGDARIDSDIDVLILVDKPVVDKNDEERVFACLYPIELSSGIAINPVIMPRNLWGSRITPFYINVENEGILL